MKKALIHLACVLFFGSLAHGDIYSWTDDAGTRHFTNIAPPLNETIEELNESGGFFQKQHFKVLKVFDGDTIKVAGFDLTFKIRLVGIDSPEIGFNGRESQPFSQEARRYLLSLLDNRKVRIKSYGTGGYNRQLAEVFIGDRNINLEMIRAGLAESYTGKPPEKFDPGPYQKEELKARRAQKGMWAQGRRYKSPRQWRKEHPGK